MPSFPVDRRPAAGFSKAGLPALKGDSMLKGIVAALALGLALPALANKGDTNKDIKDAASDTVDSAKDGLHTDSGADKAKRHMDKSGRSTKRKARHTKNNMKRDLGIK